MNTGMQDAFNLAWKLAMVVRGEARPALLDSYSVERSAVGDAVLRDAGGLTHVAVLRNPVAQAIRDRVVHVVLGLSRVTDRMASKVTELAIAYPSSPLSVTGSGATKRGGPSRCRRAMALAGGRQGARVWVAAPASPCSDLPPPPDRSAAGWTQGRSRPPARMACGLCGRTAMSAWPPRRATLAAASAYLAGIFA